MNTDKEKRVQKLIDSLNHTTVVVDGEKRFCTTARIAAITPYICELTPECHEDLKRLNTMKICKAIFGDVVDTLHRIQYEMVKSALNADTAKLMEHFKEMTDILSGYGLVLEESTTSTALTPPT